MRKKHRRDHNHGKGGMVSGNPRFNGKRGCGELDQRPTKLRTEKKKFDRKHSDD